MKPHDLSPDQLKQQAHRAARQASPWIERLGRLGYAARGIVYILIGVLAFQAAIGAGGQTTGTSGALQRIAQAPFGQVLLAAVAVGLVGYAIWRFIQAALDTENKGADAKGVAVRAGYAGVALIYLGLALTAVQIIRGSGGGNSDSAEQNWTARLLSQPFGQWLVGIIGAFVIGIGAYQFYRAFTANFRQKLNLGQMDPTEEEWATRAGRLGYAARGVVFALIGIFFIAAARQANASEVRGLAGALQTLAQQPYGPWLLGIVAIGLIAYGIFGLVQARYRRMIIT